LSDQTWIPIADCWNSGPNIAPLVAESHAGKGIAPLALAACGRLRPLTACAAPCSRESLQNPDFDPTPVVKLFTPDAGATWLLTEIEPDDMLRPWASL